MNELHRSLLRNHEVHCRVNKSPNNPINITERYFSWNPLEYSSGLGNLFLTFGPWHKIVSILLSCLPVNVDVSKHRSIISKLHAPCYISDVLSDSKCLKRIKLKCNQTESIQTWLEQWRVKLNNTKSTQITFTTNRIVCPQTTIYNTPIPMRSEVTYRGLHLDQRLTWQAHTKAKRQQLNLRVKKILQAYRPNLPTVSAKQTTAA